MALSASAVLANSFGGRLLPHRSPSFTGLPQKRVTPAATGQGKKAQDVVETVLSVTGIHCSACVETIESNLKTENDIEQVQDDAEVKRVRVIHRPETIDRDRIQALIKQLGYRVA